MKKHWWKILAVVILLYVFIQGLLMPLKPGITDVSPTSAQPGTALKLSTKGYNTNFTEQDIVVAWLRLDSIHFLPALSTIVTSSNELDLTFDLPAKLPIRDSSFYASLVVESDKTGVIVYPNAIQIRQDSIDVEGAYTTGVSYQNPDEFSKTPFKSIPYRNILQETMRNTYFHVPMWFSMILIFLASMICSIKFLRNSGKNPEKATRLDKQANALVSVGLLMGILGLLTGMLWAKYTWLSAWSGDVKQNMSAICLLIYFAYFVLRMSFDDFEERARVSAVYNIFAFVAMVPLLFIIPRYYESLHPGNGGNPGFGGEDLDNTMRWVFYPAIIGWTLLGVWIAQLKYRMDNIEHKVLSE